MRTRLSEKTLEIKWEDIGNYGVAILTSWAINNGTKTFVESQHVFIFLHQPVANIIATGVRPEDCKNKQAQSSPVAYLMYVRSSVIIVCRPLDNCN